MLKHLLLAPVVLLFSLADVSYGLGSFESVKELADKYELKMPARSIFGPSACSTASKIYHAAAAKDENINNFEELIANPLFAKVYVYAYWNCRMHGHKDWPGYLFR